MEGSDAGQHTSHACKWPCGGNSSRSSGAKVCSEPSVTPEEIETYPAVGCGSERTTIHGSQSGCMRVNARGPMYSSGCTARPPRLTEASDLHIAVDVGLRHPADQPAEGRGVSQKGWNLRQKEKGVRRRVKRGGWIIAMSGRLARR